MEVLIDIIVDFLMPGHNEIAKNYPPILADFVVQRAGGADPDAACPRNVAYFGHDLVLQAAAATTVRFLATNSSLSNLIFGFA